jgi:hypothetical protein
VSFVAPEAPFFSGRRLDRQSGCAGGWGGGLGVRTEALRVQMEAVGAAKHQAPLWTSRRKACWLGGGGQKETQVHKGRRRNGVLWRFKKRAAGAGYCGAGWCGVACGGVGWTGVAPPCLGWALGGVGGRVAWRGVGVRWPGEQPRAARGAHQLGRRPVAASAQKRPPRRAGVTTGSRVRSAAPPTAGAPKDGPGSPGLQTRCPPGRPPRLRRRPPTPCAPPPPRAPRRR